MLASRFKEFAQAVRGCVGGLRMGMRSRRLSQLPADIISDANNGLLVPVEDVKVLGKELDRLIEFSGEEETHACKHWV